jgi:hypothetical protein
LFQERFRILGYFSRRFFVVVAAASMAAVPPQDFDALIEPLALTAGGRPELLKEEIELQHRQ